MYNTDLQHLSNLPFFMQLSLTGAFFLQLLITQLTLYDTYHYLVSLKVLLVVFFNTLQVCVCVCACVCMGCLGLES